MNASALSLDKGPAFWVPVRYFATAPLFAGLAGALLLWAGPEALTTRWNPTTLALTHLWTVGFLAMVMVGALMQVLPVAVGASVPHPERVGGDVHRAVVLGAAALPLAFLAQARWLFLLAGLALGAALVAFALLAARALAGLAKGPGRATVIGLRVALASLGVAAVLGGLLAVGLAAGARLPFAELVDLHAGWAQAGFGGGLLLAVSQVVVPMFQVTPPYAPWFSRWSAPALLGGLLAWSLAVAAVGLAGARWLLVVPAGLAVAFALQTLGLQLLSKRAVPDASQRLWQLGLASLFLAAAGWGFAGAIPALGAWAGWPLLLGVLVLHGGLGSIVNGMLGKIVPFLVWLHLQAMPGRVGPAPTMRQVMPEAAQARHAAAHASATLGLVLGVLSPSWCARPAGALVLVAAGLQAWNLLQALQLYQRHLPSPRSVPA